VIHCTCRVHRSETLLGQLHKRRDNLRRS
jgi:hypothetical protein